MKNSAAYWRLIADICLLKLDRYIILCQTFLTFLLSFCYSSLIVFLAGWVFHPGKELWCNASESQRTFYFSKRDLRSGDGGGGDRAELGGCDRYPGPAR
jgi:hypothetical protein